jgi:hypothetical protein
MADKPGSGNPLDKVLQTLRDLHDVESELGGLLTGLVSAGILSFLKPNQQDAVKAYGAIALVGSAIAIRTLKAIRRPRDDEQQKKAVLPALGTILRFLQPFEERDAADLPERADDTGTLFTWVTGEDFRFGVLYGDSGCGKTSLLRAGLQPCLRREGYLPIYIGSTGTDPLTSLGHALARQSAAQETTSADGTASSGVVGRSPSLPPPAAGPELDGPLRTLAKPPCKGIVILWDQVEQFFVANQSPATRKPFLQWIGEHVHEENLPVAFLCAVRSDFLALMSEFGEYGVPDPLSQMMRYQLRHFRPVQAKVVLRSAVERQEAYFEPGVIDAIVNDLTVDDAIRPIELQIVGTLLKRDDVSTLERYKLAGRADGQLSSYIKEEIKTCSDPALAQAILWLFCSASSDVRRSGDFSLGEIQSRVQASGRSPTADKVAGILDRLIQACLIVQTGTETYNLAHDYLVPYVRRATGEIEKVVEDANRLLLHYLAAYNVDRRVRIPWRARRAIARHAMPDPEHQAAAQHLLALSKRSTLVNLSGQAGLVLLIIALVTGAATYRPWQLDDSLTAQPILNEKDGFSSANAMSLDPHTRWAALVDTIGSQGQDGKVWLWNLTTHSLTVPPGGTFSAEAVAAEFDSTGRQVAAVTTDGAIHRWSWTGKEWAPLRPLRPSVAPPCTMSSAAYSFGNGTVAFGDQCNGVTIVWRGRGRSHYVLQDRAYSGKDYYVASLALSPAGDRLIMDSENRGSPSIISVWQLSEGKGMILTRCSYDPNTVILSMTFDSHGTPLIAEQATNGRDVNIRNAMTKRLQAAVMTAYTPQPGNAAIAEDVGAIALFDDQAALLAYYEKGPWIWGLHIPI